jgi:hypothetical protein
MTNTPQKIDKDVLQEKISCLLETNGTMPETQRNQLTTYLMLDMREDIKTLMLLVARVQKLEATNIIMWAKSHNKMAWGIFWGLVIFAATVHQILPFISNIIKQAAGFIP